jgi:hypothetical protein
MGLQAAAQERLLETTDQLDIAPITGTHPQCGTWRVCVCMCVLVCVCVCVCVCVHACLSAMLHTDGGSGCCLVPRLLARVVVMAYPGLDRYGHRLFNLDEVQAY